ncbi:MAG: hypothetical protein ACI8RD_001453 [Bacillariaceae sp.]|jgi:hypothetical protein
MHTNVLMDDGLTWFPVTNAIFSFSVLLTSKNEVGRAIVVRYLIFVSGEFLGSAEFLGAKA